MKNPIRSQFLLLTFLSLCAVTTLLPATPQQRLASSIQSGRSPVGSIVAWHPDNPGTPNLPAGWKPCDGQMVTDVESPYFSQLMPDLNGEARYLRGGLFSGIMQEDATSADGLSATTGIAGNHGHSMGSAGTHSHSRTNVGGIGSSRGFAAAGNQSGSTSTNSAGNHSHSIGTAGSHTHTIALSGDSETRPITMSVVWIMRIK